MQRFAGSCSPEQLHTMQSIFDLIWMELRAHTTVSFSGPLDPDGLREEIARRVLNSFGSEHTPPEEIIRDVLASFGIQPNTPPSKSNGKLHHTGAP